MTDQALTTTEPQRPKPAMTVGGNVGALIPQDIEQAFRIASALAHSGMAPNGFQTPEKCFVAIMAGAELGLPPFQSLQSFAIINGRPTIYGAALMAVIRTNGFKVREWFEGEGDTLTAFCEVTRPDNGDVAEASYSVEDAKTAKLWGKAGPWTTSPKRMLQWRARGFCFNDGAADVLKGLQIREAVEYDEPLPDEPEARKGTGLLAKLESGATLATEGFGIRDVSDEAGEASPAPEPKPKQRRKKAVDDALNAAGEELAAEEAAHDAALAEAEATFDPVDPRDRVDDAVHLAHCNQGEVLGTCKYGEEETCAALHGTLDATADPENLPADAQVEETAATDVRVPLSGPAPADTLYFMADKEAFPSGRRVVFLNGQSEKEAIDDTPDVPTYTEHAPKAAAATVSDTVQTPATIEDEGGRREGMEWTPQDDFHAELTGAKDGAEVVLALRTLFQSGQCGTPELKRQARIKAWEACIDLNAGGAKIDPVSDPFLMASFIEWSDDIEAIEGLLVMARDKEWFQAGGEPMQAGVARAVMDRVSNLRGA